MTRDRNTVERVPIANEQLAVDKRTVETGRFRLTTHVDKRTAWVEQELAREDVHAEWVNVNREIDAVPEIRTEGDTLIIALFEEVLVVEKRLVLRQELRLTRRMVIEPHREEVPLRRMRADVERVRPPGKNTQSEDPAMRILTAFYDTRDHAEQARQQLLRAGLSAEDVTLSSAEQSDEAAEQQGSSNGGGFLQSVKNLFMPDHDRHAYQEGMQRGGILLTARAPDGEEDRVVEILDSSGAIDFDARQTEWRNAGWQGLRSEERATPDGGAAESDMTIPVAEERLAVGKREVDRGSVRVRSYVTETPVHEQVSLREEHVNVERRPVDERVSGPGDSLFEERSFEVSERSEEAVVGKETIITEELHVSKDVSEHTEDIDDMVRHTEVDVEDGRGRAPGVQGDAENRRDH